MPPLQPSVIVKIHGTLLRGYGSRAAMVELFAKVDHWFTDFEAPGDQFRSNVLTTLKTADDEGWLSKLLRVASDGRQDDTDLATLAAAYAPSAYAVGIDHFGLCRLSGGYVMIDRDPLRRSMRRLYAPDQERILVVTGKDQSGKSYTRRLIWHLTEMLGTFSVIDIDLERQARLLGPDRTFYPDDIARLVLQRLHYDLVVPPPPEDQQWPRWNLEFCDAFEERALRDPERRWVVLDAFNKVVLSDQVIDLIKELAVRVSQQLSRFRFILVGYRSGIPPEVLPTVIADSPDPIDEGRLMEFLLRYLAEENPHLDDEERTEQAATAVADLLDGLDQDVPDYLVKLAQRLVAKLRKLTEEP